jgi:hypothetical protein
LGPFFFRLLEDNKPSQKKIDHAFVRWAGSTEKEKDSGEEKLKKKGKALYYFFETPEKKNQPNSEHKKTQNIKRYM